MFFRMRASRSEASVIAGFVCAVASGTFAAPNRTETPSPADIRLFEILIFVYLLSSLRNREKNGWIVAGVTAATGRRHARARKRRIPHRFRLRRISAGA